MDKKDVNSLLKYVFDNLIKLDAVSFFKVTYCGHFRSLGFEKL